MRRTTGRHLDRDAAGDDQQVGLARRGAEGLEAEARDVDARGDDRHHLDRAAGEAEGRREERVRARPVDGAVERRGQDRLLDVAARARSPSRSPRSRSRASSCRARRLFGSIGSRVTATRALPAARRSANATNSSTTNTISSPSANGADARSSHRDREHEDDLDVEEDEQHRDEVEADAEAEAALDLRRQAAFVGLRLRGDPPPRPEGRVEERERQTDDRAQDHEHDRREVAADHSGVISLPWDPCDGVLLSGKTLEFAAGGRSRERARRGGLGRARAGRASTASPASTASSRWYRSEPSREFWLGGPRRAGARDRLRGARAASCCSRDHRPRAAASTGSTRCCRSRSASSPSSCGSSPPIRCSPPRDIDDAQADRAAARGRAAGDRARDPAPRDGRDGARRGRRLLPRAARRRHVLTASRGEENPAPASGCRREDRSRTMRGRSSLTGAGTSFFAPGARVPARRRAASLPHMIWPAHGSTRPDRQDRRRQPRGGVRDQRLQLAGHQGREDAAPTGSARSCS